MQQHQEKLRVADECPGFLSNRSQQRGRVFAYLPHRQGWRFTNKSVFALFHRMAMLCYYGGQSRRCIWTLRHPHLIQPYLAYYDHLASHYGGPWCPHIPCWCDQKHLQVPEPPIYGKMVGLPVPDMLTMGSPHTNLKNRMGAALYGELS